LQNKHNKRRAKKRQIFNFLYCQNVNFLKKWEYRIGCCITLDSCVILEHINPSTFEEGNVTVEAPIAQTPELFWELFQDTGSLVAYIMYSKLKT